MERWLTAALAYIPQWIEHQMRLTEQPGCAIAIAHRGKLVLDMAFGHADLSRGAALTPRHRFRVASHSKSFTAAGVLKLREQGRLQLDDRVGRFVAGLHPRVASATLAQLLSHGAGVVRDGADAGQWSDRRPFLDEAALRADLAAGPVIEPNTRLKYSNHGYGLIALALEAVTGERYVDWIAREIVAAAGLRETTPDAPVDAALPFARGHSAKWPLGRRLTIPGDNPTCALAAATGFVSTAGDLARFFASLAPDAKKSVLTCDSRREMGRRQWLDPHSSLERWYGLGTIGGTLADWDWQGHTGGFQGTTTRTACVPAQGLTVSVLTNAADGPSLGWVDGALHILRAYAHGGAPSRRNARWSGRWWSLWGAIDLLPMEDKVLVANPALLNPLQDATELAIDGPAQGRIALAGGFGSHGEAVRMERSAGGAPTAFWLGGTRLRSEAVIARELTARYDSRPAAHVVERRTLRRAR
jgi:D-alanyl-D-alanine carboxypeptidase